MRNLMISVPAFLLLILGLGLASPQAPAAHAASGNITKWIAQPTASKVNKSRRYRTRIAYRPNGTYYRYRAVLKVLRSGRDRSNRLCYQFLLGPESSWQFIPKRKKPAGSLPQGKSAWRTSQGIPMTLYRGGNYVEGTLGGYSVKGSMSGQLFKGGWSGLYDQGSLTMVFSSSRGLKAYQIVKGKRVSWTAGRVD